MGKKEKEAAKKARKLAARAKRAQQESAVNEEKDPGFGGTAATPSATAPTTSSATSAVPRFGEAPQVSVDQVSLSADPLPLDRLGDDIKAFRSVVGRRDRRGKPLSAPLVQSCVAGCLGYGATAADAAADMATAAAAVAAATPTPIQSEAWARALATTPPDLIAISPTGSGKTLAFLLPALAEVMGQRGGARGGEDAAGAAAVAAVAAAAAVASAADVDDAAAGAGGVEGAEVGEGVGEGVGERKAEDATAALCGGGVLSEAVAASDGESTAGEGGENSGAEDGEDADRGGGNTDHEAEALVAAAKEAWQLALDKAMDDMSLSLDAIERRAQAAYDFALAGGKGGKGGAASVEEGTPRAEKGAEKRAEKGAEKRRQVGTQGAQFDKGTGIGGADGSGGCSDAGVDTGENDGKDDLVSPAVLILSPTRELCEQTGKAVDRVMQQLAAAAAAAAEAAATGTGASGSSSSSSSSSNRMPRALSSASIIGGVDFVSQRAALQQGRPDLIVATPGRLLSLCGEIPASTLARRQEQGLGGGRGEGGGGEEEEDVPEQLIRLDEVSLLVIDEADRLLELGCVGKNTSERERAGEGSRHKDT
jgi:hypothetical protein